jgi:hypothetical protein
MRPTQPDHTPKMTGLLLSTLLPDAQQAIIRVSCDGMHSADADAAASAQDAATALRLTCRTLRAAVDATVRQLGMRVISSRDIESAAARFPGVHYDVVETTAATLT